MISRIRIPFWASLSMLFLSMVGIAFAGETTDWSERQHVYLEECGRSKTGAPACKFVYYSLAYTDRIALELGNPHKAASIPLVVESHPKLESLARACGLTSEKLLEYKTLEKDNLDIASYEVNGCQEPGQLLWIASSIARELDDVELGGLIVRKRNDSNLYLYLDEVMVRIRNPIAIPFDDSNRDLLEVGQLELVGPDPFDPGHQFLLRTRRPKKLSLERDPTADELSEARDSLVRTDVLICSAVGGRAMGPSADWCDSRGEVFVAENDRERGSRAAEDFREHEPISIVPTLIPISSKGPHAGFDAWLKGEKNVEDKFSGKVTVNSISNQTEERDSSTLSVDFSGNLGSYPGELSLKVGAQVEFGKETVDENVTKLLVTYDRYLKPWIEVYGFTERFTNNFMSIAQRWEGGFGMLLELDAKKSTRDSYCDEVGYRYFGRGREIRVTKKAQQRLEQYQNRVRQQLFRQGYISDELQQDYCKYKRGIEKRNAKLQLGLALSALADFEEPDTLIVRARENQDDEDPATLKVTPPSTQVFRLSMRPTITYRPHDRVTLDAWYYFKWDPDPDDDALYGSGDDLRREWTVQADLKLNDSDPKVSLTASITRYEDERPPRISAVDVFNQAVAGITFAGDMPMPMDAFFVGSLTGNDRIVAREMVTVDGFVAQGKHTVIKGGLSVSF